MEDSKTITGQPPEKRKLKKIVKDSMSNLSFLKITGTSLAAVSMALISARLTSVVSSLILVAIVSVGTAVLSEVYKVILSATSLGAKKVIKPVLKIQKVDEETGEIHIVEEPLEETEEPPTSSFKSFLSHLWSNRVIRMVVLFAFVSTLTIMTSYFVSNASSEGKTTYTNITQPVQELSDQEKSEISSDAEKKAAEAASSADEKIAQLEKDNETLQSQLDAANQKNTDQDTTIQDLKDSIEELQKQQKLLEESQSSDSGTETPEPSPSPSTTRSDATNGDGSDTNGTTGDDESSNGSSSSNQ